ncbi:MAG: zinc ribbon domain-containing protein [Clostridia bacterium]|nr:zinc ribbon domain-containing protein [Clostridia bacterium]
MPFYDLRCNTCQEEFNIMAKMSDREQKKIKCPKCGNNDLSAIFKTVNITSSRKSGEADCPNIHKCGGGCHHG